MANAKVIGTLPRSKESKTLIKEEQQSASSKHSTIVNVIALPDEEYRLQQQEQTLPQLSNYHHHF